MGRFSTGHGRFVGIANLPKVLVSLRQALIRKMFGHIPRKPWIPFSAADAIDKITKSTWIAWEIGSGFSTLWLADRVASVTSIEASKEWYDLLSMKIEGEGMTNVDLRFEWRGEEMASFAGCQDKSIDLLFIDGGPRGLCLANGYSKVRPGGYIYLDNWDNDSFWSLADREFVFGRQHELESMHEYVDYVPAQVGVYAGLLIKKAE